MVLAICGGIVFGLLAGRFIDLSLGGDSMLPDTPVSRQTTERQLEEKDFQIILSRNLFNSAAVGESFEQVDLSLPSISTATAAEPLAVIADLTLIGTIVAGKDSLALIQSGKKVGIFKLEDEPAPGISIAEITRKMVVLIERGKRRELPLKQTTGAHPKQVRQSHATTGQRDGIVSLAEGRWQISKSVADNARANLNSLLQSARMIPELDNGKTVGFKLVEIEKGSLLEKIGLRVGDLIVEINQVELNSPEKALQIFQQLREANNISLGLMRNGQPETFEYSFE
ncbi:MAG: PDZ domain-containing protein [Deltaproteobacteria bacterium]|nr:PDZ domain-containing protein [Deltaproteobacteria bacterium]